MPNHVIGHIAMYQASQPRQSHNPHSDVKLWKWMKTYTSFVYRYPYVPILFTLVVTLVLSLWLFFVYGVHPAGNTNYYRWSGDEISNRWDNYVAASQNTYSSFLNYLGSLIPLPRQFQLTQMGCVIYERPGKNMLDLEALKEVWKLEDEMHATPGWDKYCFHVPIEGLPPPLMGMVNAIMEMLKDRLSALEPETNCIAFKSIITDFKTYMTKTHNITNPTVDDLTQEIIIEVLNSSDGERIAGTYLGNDYDPVKFTTTRSRSMFPFAFPLEGYKNKADRQKEQEDILGKWQLEFIKPVNRMLEKEPYGVRPFHAFPFAMNFLISDIILEQVWWLVGSFAFLFVWSVFAMRTVFVSILGVIGVFLPIPCALALLNGVFQIHHVDVIDVIGLFLICGIGADCLFIVFELYRHARGIYGHEKKELRLAYASQRGLIALSTSISTSAVTFIALCTSGVRIMNFFGIFCFLMLLFTFIFTFSWYLGILAIWAKYWEKKPAERLESEEEGLNESLNTIDENEGPNNKPLNMQTGIDYPYSSCFAMFAHKPVFKIDAANINKSSMNFYEKFFYNYITPVIYHYRLVIALLFFCWSAIFCGLSFRIETKSELSFLPPDHHYQRAYTLALNGFKTALNDFSFVYVWGLKEKPTVPFSHRLTIDKYGMPEFKPFNITDPKIQEHLNNTWKLINEQTDLIDPIAAEAFSCSPWDTWNWIFNMDKTINPWIKPIVEWLNLTTFPTDLPITKQEYEVWKFAWQAVLSEYAYEEPDSYVPGTLKANTIGFSDYDYSLKYIAMKSNMIIPQELTIETMRDLYHKAEKLANKIEANAPDGFEGFFTSVAWLTMVTEEQLPKQIVKDVAIAFACGAAVIFISTTSFLYTVLVVYCMICVVFLILGCLALSGWQIGTNESIMISIASGFCADFIIQPMLALSHDFTSRSLYGKIQASLTTFCTPVTSAMITTLVAAAFLYPCEILMFPPFATFLLGSGVFGIVHGFIVLPALIGLFAPKGKEGTKLITLYTAQLETSTISPSLDSQEQPVE